MTDNQNANPFAFWQQFWQSANPQMAQFLPPATLEETERKITELKSVEMWLNFNLQVLQSQLLILEQQKNLFTQNQETNEQKKP